VEVLPVPVSVGAVDNRDNRPTPDIAVVSVGVEKLIQSWIVPADEVAVVPSVNLNVAVSVADPSVEAASTLIFEKIPG